jgi:hypothetical protein
MQPKMLTRRGYNLKFMLKILEKPHAGSEKIVRIHNNDLNRKKCYVYGLTVPDSPDPRTTQTLMEKSKKIFAYASFTVKVPSILIKKIKHSRHSVIMFHFL